LIESGDVHPADALPERGVTREFATQLGVQASPHVAAPPLGAGRSLSA
jgi:hypothetical protein